MKQYVIIGNGTAAVSCVEGIRSIDEKTPITIVSEELYPAYCRPLISYYLEGKTDRNRMQYRPDDFYETNGCTVLYGKTAVHLSVRQKTVTLSDGQTLSYDALCVATGSTPFVPPIPGLETVAKKHTFLKLDDAIALEQAVTPDSRVLIVGAGLIGLKCAEGLSTRAKSITVCDLADRVLSSILDNACAARMQTVLEQHGIRFLLSDTAARFDGNTAIMQGGEQIPFDVLVLAIGVRPNTALVRESGGKINRGILVDAQMRTSLPGVYAAGDCAEGMDISCGSSRVLAVLPNANLQGFCAGVNMAGGTKVFDNAIPMNAIGFFGLHALSAGSDRSDEPGGAVYEESDEWHLKRLFLKDDNLTGFMLIGDTARAGIYTSLIRRQTPLHTLDFDRLKQTPTTAAFSKETRKKTFGGAV